MEWITSCPCPALWLARRPSTPLLIGKTLGAARHGWKSAKAWTLSKRKQKGGSYNVQTPRVHSEQAAPLSLLAPTPRPCRLGFYRMDRKLAGQTPERSRSNQHPNRVC